MSYKKLPTVILMLAIMLRVSGTALATTVEGVEDPRNRCVTPDFNAELQELATPVAD